MLRKNSVTWSKDYNSKSKITNNLLHVLNRESRISKGSYKKASDISKKLNIIKNKLKKEKKRLKA